MCKTHVLGGSKRLLLKHIHASFNMVDYLESNLKTDTILWWALEKGTCFFCTWLTIFGYVSKLCGPTVKIKSFPTKTHTTKRSCFVGACLIPHILKVSLHPSLFNVFILKKRPPRFVSITLAQRTQGQHQQGTRYLRQSDPKPLADISHWNPGWLVGVLKNGSL